MVEGNFSVLLWSKTGILSLNSELDKLHPDKPKNFAEEICVRDVLREASKDEVGEAREPFSSSGPLQSKPEVSEDTASIVEQEGVLTKKDPEDSVVAANDKLARLIPLVIMDPSRSMSLQA